jgi:hypothetical protein
MSGQRDPMRHRWTSHASNKHRAKVPIANNSVMFILERWLSHDEPACVPALREKTQVGDHMSKTWKMHMSSKRDPARHR